MHSQSQASTTQILQTALALLSGCLRMHSSSLSFHKHAAVVLLICLGAATCTHAKRAATYNARARSGEAWAQLNQSSAVTSYGKPVVEQLTKTTSVDHFSQAQYEPDGDSTFELRYVLIRPATPPNTSTPILLFCSEESALEDSQVGSGYYSDIANSIGALQIWPEHRYYATQQPFRPSDSRFVYLNIEQALVDQIEVVLHTQRTLGLSHSPVIAVGSSYSGQLAAWLRVRYPDVIAGAISSSPTLLGAPGLGLDPSYDPYGFAKIATRTASSEAGSAAACPTNVHKFFTTLFARAQTAEGLEQINTDLNLCRNSEVQSYDDVNATLAYYVLSNWASAAQFNFPYALPGTGQTDIPAYPVREACNLLANDTLEGTPLFYAMGQALPIFSGNANISGGCLDTSAGGPSAFGYQICTQDYTPVSYDGVQDMFYDLPYNLDSNSQRCLQQYGVAPQYDWSASTFGLSSLRSSSNIFFTNGIYDPFTACGPTVNISDTITATIYEGPHAFDVESTKPEDPASAVQARAQGLQYIQTWVNQYNAQKASIPMSNPSDLFNLAFDVGGYTSAWNNTLPGSNTNNTDANLSGTAAVYNSSV